MCIGDLCIEIFQSYAFYLFEIRGHSLTSPNACKELNLLAGKGKSVVCINQGHATFTRQMLAASFTVGTLKGSLLSHSC